MKINRESAGGIMVSEDYIAVKKITYHVVCDDQKFNWIILKSDGILKMFLERKHEE